MKRDELIRRIMEADPEGTAEFCVGNADIYCLEPKPAYYEGYLQLLIHDEKLKPFYSIVGAKRTGKGNKVCIRPMSIEDCLWDDPELSVDYSELSDNVKERYFEQDEEVRKKSLKIETELEIECFISWVTKKLHNADVATGIIKETATKAFNDYGLSYKDPLPEYKNELIEKSDAGTIHPSYIQCREYKWDHEFEVSYDDVNSFSIIRR